VHTTLAGNGGGDGSGVLVEAATVALTNTILAGHTVGITVAAGSTATLAGTLWYGNGANWDGAGTVVTGTVNVWNDPVFAHAAGGNYHLREGSAALDVGLDAGVAVDLDRQARPNGLGFDLGADEFWPPWRVYVPVVWRQSQ
jgi:hypothetical protein